ncbi:MAG: [glutamine synthetase] adenylyltransferase / [glutamine synthetase]-adenylyl-L-tyrosine [Verrucomicrobiota bacterium]|jgi:glutamate-ammonia-ligase adenylyltransferase
MSSRIIQTAIRAAADPRRAGKGFEHLPDAARVTDAAQARILAAIFSGSRAMTELLGQHPQWIPSILTPDYLQHARKEQGLRRDIALLSEPGSGDGPDVFGRLRESRQREMFRIAARDLAGLGVTREVMEEISNVADVVLDATLGFCLGPLVARFGQPFHQDSLGRWTESKFCVIGLGKLGGRELNYSSDVDLIFVYSEEGVVFRKRPAARAAAGGGMRAHAFFKRLAESFVAEVGRATADGALYRVDLRLRPEGEAGPLVRSLAGYENYYAQWGQTWERMMLIKARGVAGDPSLAAEFQEMVQPFRYPRSLGEGALHEIAAMKRRIERDVIRPGELKRDIKRGLGGIREIEFVAQTLQLLNAARIPFLQGAQTLPVLQKLAQYQLLTETEAGRLSAAYCFLRTVEHRLQMENNLQTHTLPADVPARRWLAAVTGFPARADFERELKSHTKFVRSTYEKFVATKKRRAASPFPLQLRGEETRWKSILAAHSFRDVDRAWKLLDEFAHGPSYVHTSSRTTELAMALVPRILALCPKQRQRQTTRGTESRAPKLSDPDRVLARLDSFVQAYGARATLVETWTQHPQLFELLLLLFDRSEFLAAMAIRTPDLVDDLVLSGRLRRAKSPDEIYAELELGAKDRDQRLWLRRYHQSEFMRIGLRDILDLSGADQNVTELSALAEACLRYALAAVSREQGFRNPPVAIIGLGKLGGQELNYGSDLDILFVAENATRTKLPRLQKLAVGIMEMLSSPSEFGVAFVTDARLRPDGEKGLLVNTLAAYESYYRVRARLWEIQALTRVRAVAGNAVVGQNFERLAAELSDFRPLAGVRASGTTPAPPLPACAHSEWKKEIVRMRARIEKERTPPGQDALAIKTGAGGLMDAEFLAQTMCLEHGWREPNTLRALERIRDEKLLGRAVAGRLVESYQQFRRVEAILRRWSFEGEVLLPSDEGALYRVSVRCGFETPEAFRRAVAEWRRNLREAYRCVIET